jgi:hypothetical protein
MLRDLGADMVLVAWSLICEEDLSVFEVAAAVVE